MTKQQTTDLFLAAMYEHGPTFGVRLLIGFSKGAETACEMIGEAEAARLAAQIAQELEGIAVLTAKLEAML